MKINKIYIFGFLLLLLFGIIDRANCQTPMRTGVIASRPPVTVLPIDSTDGLTFITVAGITDTIQKAAIYRLVNDLKGISNGGDYATSNIWAKFIAIYPFIGGTSTTCSYNLKNTSTFRITFVNGPELSAAGYVGTIASYMRPGIIPSANMTLNSTHISLSMSGTVATAAVADIAAVVSATQRINFFSRNGTGNLCFSDQYSTVARASTSNTTAGYFISSRTNSSTFALLKDGVSIATHGATAGALPNIQFLIGGANLADVFTPIGVLRTYNFATFGTGLTDAESLNLYNAEHFFNVTTLGR